MTDIIKLEGRLGPVQTSKIFELDESYQRKGWKTEDVIRLFQERYGYQPNRVWEYHNAAGVQCVACEVRK